MDLKGLKIKAEKVKKENKSFLLKLKKKPPKNLDNLVEELHDEEFKRINCLDCANCCNTTGPLFTQKDIERISSHLRIKPGAFTEKYLRVDEDNDFVLKKVPCEFLHEDNTCGIYSVRPKACREYPHTDRKKFHQLANITLNNTSVCPAVYNIVEELKSHIKP